MVNPIVSVLITAYNREAYIAEAINSVLLSSFTDFEIIIVDDCSTDNTLNIAKRIAAKDTRIRVYSNESNLGDYPNRNKAASYAKGRYLKYVDADDVIYPHGLQVMVDAMEQFPDAALGLQCVIREHRQPYPFLVDTHEAFREHFLGNGFFTSGPTGAIIRADTFREIGGFSGKRFVGDTECWISLALIAPVVLFQPALIWWRTHDGQEFQAGNDGSEYVEATHNLYINCLSSVMLPFSQQERALAIGRYKRYRARTMIRSLACGNIRKANILRRYAGVSLLDALRALTPA